MTIALFRSKRAALLGSAGFYLPFNDLGSGAVDTTVYRGSGSATFTRASAATTMLRSGLIGTVGSGVARSCYSIAGAYLGYLAEPAGTQLVTPTASIRDMTNGAWAVSNMSTALTATGADGVANSATTITATGSNATILQTLTAAASSRMYSCLIKRRAGTGTILLLQGATTTDITSQLNTSAYSLVRLNASVLNVAFGIQINSSGDALDVDMNQFEAGISATSRMLSSGAARAVDKLIYPFAGNMNASSGWAYAEITSNWSASTGVFNHIIGLDNTNAGALMSQAGGVSTISINDGTSRIDKGGLLSTFTGIRKRASTWGPVIGRAITGDGLAPATGVFDGAMPNTSICIGCITDATDPWNGTIKSVRIGTSELQLGGLQAITA